MTITTIPVRRARPFDRESILDLCRENHAENGQFSLNMGKVEGMVDRAFAKDNSGDPSGVVIGVTGEPQRVEGAILLLISQFWYTSDWCLEEVFNFVRPEYRRSTHAKDMIRFGMRAADELAIPLVIGVVSNERTRAKVELYRRQLGEPVGGYFIHRPAAAVSMQA